MRTLLVIFALITLAITPPYTVVPKPISAKVQDGKLALKLEPKSVTVISVEQ